MSEYSPTITRQYVDPTKAFSDALETALLRQREARAAGDTHDAATEAYVANGGRYGAPPQGGPPPAGLPSPAPIPSAVDAATHAGFTNQLAAGMAKQPTTTAGSGSPFGAALDREFNKSRATPTQALEARRTSSPSSDEDSTGGGWGGASPEPQARLSDAMQRGADNGALASRPAPTTPAGRASGGSSTPGAFDPVMGGFAPAQHSGLPSGQPEPDGRYIATGPDRYVDTQKTRQAQQIALSQALLEGRNAGAYDRMLGQTGSRERVAGMNNDARAERADDDRASRDERAADADARARDIANQRDATMRLGFSLRAANAGNAGKSITATAKEANANKAAASFLNIYGGDYPKALEALKNSPEGQDLVASGVEPRHLYIAHGAQLGVDTKATVGLLGSSKDAPSAVAKLGAARKAVLGTGGAQPEPAFTDAEVLAAHNAGKRTDADITAWIRAQRGAKKP